MKSLFITLFLIAIGFTVKANDPDLFKLDYDAVQKEFAGLEQVTDILSENPFMTYSMLMETNALLSESLNLTPLSALPMSPGEPFLGIPSFLWGCSFGIVGVLIVYIGSDKNEAEAKKALWGCVVGTAVSTGIVIVLYYTAFIALFSFY